jgi:AcrR family transcriptional regulator
MREAILRAAVELFGSRGYDSVSLRDVTAEVGLKPTALYNHFRSKEELLIAAIDAALEAFNQQVVDGDDVQAPPVERLDAMIRRHVLYQIENATLAKANDRLIDSLMLDRLGTPEDKRAMRARMRRYLDRLTEIIAAVLAEQPSTTLNARMCALTIGTMCDYVLRWYRPGGPESPERIVRRLSEMARNMLKVP